MTRIQRSRKTFVLMLAACLLAACEHKPAAPGDVVRASNEAVLQCSVDTDCMLNRVCDGGQCKLATGTSSASMGAQPGAAIEAMVAARRKAGEICLFNNAQILERHYVANLTYEGARLPGCEAETAQYYKLTSALGARTYTLTVTPLGAQASDTHCVALSINQSGVRTESSTAADASQCLAGASSQDLATPAAMSPTAETTTTATALTTTPDLLRREAANAYAENRIYAPAGNNTVEFYLALREQQPGDAGAVAGLNDLLPMTVTGAEQSIARRDFAEARRLIALIEKIDARHSALQRLKDSIDIGRTSARPVAPPSSPDTRPRYKPAPSPTSTPRPAPQQVSPHKARYMGADGCMYEADGRPVLGFKRECDAK